MINPLIDVSIKTMVGQLPDIITKNNESINKEFALLIDEHGSATESNPEGLMTLIVPSIDTTNGGIQDGQITSYAIKTTNLTLNTLHFLDEDSKKTTTKSLLQVSDHNDISTGRYLWKQNTIVTVLPDVSVGVEMKKYCHNAGAIGVRMANNEVKSLAEIINEMITDMEAMKTTYHGSGNGAMGGDGYVNIYGAPKKSTQLTDPDSFTFDNNLLFSTKTQLKRMNLPPYQYDDLSGGFIYTYYSYNPVTTITDEHTSSLTGIPGQTTQIKFNDLKKKAFYRIILSRKEKKFLRVSKDELVRLTLICTANSDEFGSEWDVETYSVRNSEDLVIERK